MSTAISLYQIEDDLAALVDTAEGGIDPAQEAAFLEQFSATLQQAKDKRDACARFFAHCEAMEQQADAEIARLTALKQSFVKARERLAGYVVTVIKSLGKDDKDKFRKLEGNICKLSIQANPNPKSVLITDGMLVPRHHQKLTIKVDGATFDTLINSAELEAVLKFMEIAKTQVEYDLRAIKAEIENNSEVLGATLTGGTEDTLKYRLVCK